MSRIEALERVAAAARVLVTLPRQTSDAALGGPSYTARYICAEGDLRQALADLAAPPCQCCERMERYRVALNRIARHSEDDYARDRANDALCGGER